jgi:hypothetical protein
MTLHGSDAVEDELDEMLAEGQDGAGEYANLLQSRDPELTEVATRFRLSLVFLLNLFRVERFKAPMKHCPFSSYSHSKAPFFH